MKSLCKQLLSVSAMLVLFALSGVGYAQNTIEGFNVTQQGGQTLVQITTKTPLRAAPANFTVANPARIAFDFPNTVNGLGKNSQDVEIGRAHV